MAEKEKEEREKRSRKKRNDFFWFSKIESEQFLLCHFSPATFESRSAFVRLRGFFLPLRHVSASIRSPGDSTRRHVDWFVRYRGRKRAFFFFAHLPIRIVRPSQLLHSLFLSLPLSLSPLSSPLTAEPACACDDDEDDLLLALAEEIGEEDAGGKADEEEREKATTLDATAKERPRPPPPPPPQPARAAPPRQQQQQKPTTLRPLQAPVFELGGPSRRPEPAALKIGGPFVDLLSRLRVAKPLPVSNASSTSSSSSAPSSSFTSSSSSSSVSSRPWAPSSSGSTSSSRRCPGDSRRDGLWATAGVVTFRGARKTSAASSSSFLMPRLLLLLLLLLRCSN